MITLRATADDGTEILALGITRQNLDYLQKGRPIRVSAETHPGMSEKLKVLIFYGENERVLTESVKTLIGPATKVVTVPRETGSDQPTPTVADDAIIARRGRMDLGFDHHGMPVESPRANAERVTREGDLIAAFIQKDEEIAVHFFGPPSVKFLESIDQARDGYRASLERLGLIKPEGTKH